MPSRVLTSSQPSRIEALRARHAALNSRLEDAQKSPSTNDFFLRQLKKQKLMLKEEIEGLRASEERASAS
jgi:hypothetical protein